MKSLMTWLAVVSLFAFTVGCDADVEDPGELPEVNVEADPGEMPEVDVTPPDVDVGTQESQVEVPDVDVDVDTEPQDITLPDVDVDIPEESEQ